MGLARGVKEGEGVSTNLPLQRVEESCELNGTQSEQCRVGPCTREKAVWMICDDAARKPRGIISRQKREDGLGRDVLSFCADTAAIRVQVRLGAGESAR